MITAAFALSVVSGHTVWLRLSFRNVFQRLLGGRYWGFFFKQWKLTLWCFSCFALCVTDVPGCPSMYHHSSEGYPNPPHSSDGNATVCPSSVPFDCENVPGLRRPVQAHTMRICPSAHHENRTCPVFIVPSLVKALWSLANRRRVSVSPLANQQHVHVSIGSGSRPHPCLKNP